MTFVEVLPPELTGPNMPRFGPRWPDRYWRNVDRDGPVPVARPDLGPCHLWTGSVNAKRGGYGKLIVAGRERKAHQVAMELAGKSCPPGMVPDHLCRVPACVNPDHLEAVTHRDNFLRGEHPTAVVVRTGRCKWGHERIPANLYVKRSGKSECRLCAVALHRYRRHRARRASQ